MTEPSSTTPPDIWVDFNDITSEQRLFALLSHATCDITGPGQTVTVGDHDSNRCTAVIESVAVTIVRVRLRMDTFVHAQPGADRRDRA